jgi:hypothetical protein
MNPFTPSPGPAPAESPAQADSPAAAPAAADDALAAPAVMKFKSCRWRCAPEDGEFCTHRDVLPFAGKNDFKADSWCPECAFYKLRRTPKKREWVDRNAY